MHLTLWTGVDSALVLTEVDAEGSRGSDGDAEAALGVRGRQRPDACHSPTNSLLRIEHDEKPRSAASARLRPTDARRNYFPEPPYFRETKTYHS